MKKKIELTFELEIRLQKSNLILLLYLSWLGVVVILPETKYDRVGVIFKFLKIKRIKPSDEVTNYNESLDK